MTGTTRHEPSVHEDYDCVIVGGGAAGLSAALVLGRARRRTLVLDGAQQSNRAASHVGGLLGLDGTPPAELYELGHTQVGAYETVAFRDAQAVAARAEGDRFALELAGRAGEVRARSVVLATGMTYEVPDVPGFAELWGGTVFHCPFCHGWEIRDQTVAVYAAGEIAVRLAALLAAWTADVIVVDPAEVKSARVVDGALRAMLRHDGSEVACDAVLVHAPLRQRGRLADDLGLELTDAGFVAVDSEMHTSVPGVYAAGDVAVAPQQVAVAIGSGHTAGLVAVRELLLGRPSADRTAAPGRPATKA